MAEYIEREKVIESVSGWYRKACCPENMSSYNMGERAAYTTAFSEIIELPAADVRPVVHGHWVYEEPNGANSFKGAYWCDQCHQPESYRKNFCPNCGADMREGE